MIPERHRQAANSCFHWKKTQERCSLFIIIRHLEEYLELSGGVAYIAMPAQHHTAWASASSVSANLGVRDIEVGVLSGSFSVSQITPEISCREIFTRQPPK